jgi:parallel beta-helix repeat protein
MKGKLHVLLTKSTSFIPKALVAGAAIFAGALTGLAPVPLADAATAPVFVSSQAKPTNPGTSCQAAKFNSISTAIAAASAGSSVVVCPGAYVGQVVVTKPVVLRGEGATIVANGKTTGITVPVPGVTVEGFTVRGAIGEGILVVGRPGAPVTHVTIKGNLVEGNDQGNPTGAPISKSPYRECNATGHVPGDCGEGIHLMTAADSVVEGNVVVDNSGGILLTDELGPSDHNLVEGNTVQYNVLDCGVTLASHSVKGFVKGATVPAAGGVYDNTVKGNTIVGNGTTGQGGGVLLATGAPGGAVYGNAVTGNTIGDNGLAGVTVHSHAPGQDLNGNVVEHNTIGTNNVAGDYDFSPHVDPKTTGVIVATAVGPITVTVSGNSISDNAVGVWTTGPVTMSGMATNTFTGVAVHSVVG